MRASPDEVSRLVCQARSGTSGAFDRLFELHWSSVFGICRSILRDVNDAEDAALEAFYGAYKELGALRRPQAFRTWLLRIACKTCYSRLRRRGEALVTDLLTSNDQGRDVEDDAFLTQDLDPSAALEKQEFREACWQCLYDLPAIDRAVFVARLDAELSWAQIASALSLTEGSARYRYDRARARLANCLRQRGLI